MSSTTGNVIEGERYYTPLRLAAAIVSWISEDFGTHPTTLLEPSIGGGAFANAARMRWPEVWVYGVDTDPNAPGSEYANVFRQARFEDVAGRLPMVDLCIANPPFSCAEEHARLAIELTHTTGQCAFLMRSAMFHGKKRSAFWEKYPPVCEYRLVERPSFTGGGTDSAEYSVFVWSRGNMLDNWHRTERKSWK